MTKNSVSSRMRVTKTGKLLKRTMGLSHFRAKKSGKQLHRKTNMTAFAKADNKMFFKKYGVH